MWHHVPEDRKSLKWSKWGYPWLLVCKQEINLLFLSGEIVDAGTIFTLQFYNNYIFFLSWLVHVLSLMYQTLLLANGAYCRMKLE